MEHVGSAMEIWPGPAPAPRRLARRWLLVGGLALALALALARISVMGTHNGDGSITATSIDIR